MPKVLEKALNAKAIAKITKPGTYADGGGLGLRVDDRGYRRWVWRGQVNGKAIVRVRGLGVIPLSALPKPGKRLDGSGRPLRTVPWRAHLFPPNPRTVRGSRPSASVRLLSSN